MTGNILIAEDDGDQRTILTHFLNSRGYETIAAADGKEALESFVAGRFDLLIVDLAMPNVDGWTLIRQVRERSQNQGLPVIVLTAHDFARDQAEAFKAGCNEFLAKPFDPFELLEIVQRLLGPSAGGPASVSPAI